MTTVRRAGTASVAGLSTLVLAVGVAHAVAPRWTASLGLDVWNISTAREEVRQVKANEDALHHQHDQLMREVEYIDHITARLIARRITLQAAIDQLAPLLDHRTGFDTTWRCHYHSPTFRHGVARYAINRVERLLKDDPSRWATLAPELEAEYAGLQ